MEGPLFHNSAFAKFSDPHSLKVVTAGEATWHANGNDRRREGKSKRGRPYGKTTFGHRKAVKLVCDIPMHRLIQSYKTFYFQILPKNYSPFFKITLSFFGENPR